MNAKPKLNPHKVDYDRAKQTRWHQEKALDDALKNTFPASDPFSIAPPTPPVADHGSDSGGPAYRKKSRR